MSYLYWEIPVKGWKRWTYYYNYKDLFTHKDINTYINGVV